MWNFGSSHWRALPATLALLALLACASTSGDLRQYLDETTAATVTVASRPIVFARERADLAVNARDYLTLIAVDINRAGHHAIYWFGYLWSTIDHRQAEAYSLKADQILLVADDREVELKRSSVDPHDVGLDRPPIERPARAALTILVETDAETLRFIGAVTSLRAVVQTSGSQEPFELWSDGRSSLTAFVRALPN
jgi:hypothetical protein